MRRAMSDDQPYEESKPTRAARGISEPEEDVKPQPEDLSKDEGDEFADELEITMVRRMALNLDGPVPIAKAPSLNETDDEPAEAKKPRSRRIGLDKKWLGVCVGIPAGALVLSLIFSFAGAFQAKAPVQVAAASSISRACTPIAGVQSKLHAWASQGGIELRELAADEATLVESPYQGDISKPVRMSAEDKSANSIGGIFGGKDGHSYWAQCVTPNTDSVTIAPGAEGSTLVMYNPDNEPVDVDVTISTSSGQADVPELRGLQIGGNSTQLVKLANYATDKDQIGVRVRTITGRLGVSITTKTENGMSASSAMRLSKQIVIPAAPAGAKSARLIVTNPDTTRKELHVEVLGPEGSTVVEEKLVAEAQRTQGFDLKKYLDNASAIVVSSDFEIAATLISSTDSDDAVSLGTDEFSANELAAVVAGNGNLSLTNLGDEDTQAEISWDGGDPEQIAIKARSTVSLAVPSEKKTVRVKADQPIVGAISLTDSGQSVANLSVLPKQKNMAIVPNPRIGIG